MNANQDALHSSRVEGHYGKIFFRLAASYPRLPDVVLEYVQNAIDFGATVIQVSIDRRRRGLTIRNNGPSATKEGFDNALQNVGNSEKTANKYGRFGIGLISALGKCDSFTFTTLVGKEALRWTFDCETIREMRQVAIPRQVITQEALRALDSDNVPHRILRWSSELAVSKFTKDARKSAVNIEELRQRILASYSVRMREHGIVVWICETNEMGITQKPVAVRAHDFAGRPLDEVTIPRGVMGETRIRLFVVPKGDKRKGSVLVGTTMNPFRIPFHFFVRQLHKDDLPGEVVSAFESGVYEGEILHSKINLDANRQRFDEDDHLTQFCADLWEWFDEHGRQHIEEAESSIREERFQGLGKRLLETLNLFIERNAELAALIQGAGKPGLNGAEFLKASNPKTGTGGKGSVVYKPRKPRTDPVGEKPKNPLEGTVENPSGKRRMKAENTPQGLQIVYEEYMELELWELDLHQRTLSFNTRHPLFVACDRTDRDSLRFQEMIAMSALSLELLTEEEKEVGRRYLEKQVPQVVELLTKSPNYTGGYGPKKFTT